MATYDDAIDRLAEEIARYLSEHPSAADSAEGIRRWWLLRQRFDEASEQVQQALDILETAGQVRKEELRDGTMIYRAVEPSSSTRK